MDPQLWECNVILGPKWPIYPNQVFFSKNYQFKFRVPFGTFHSAKLKKKILRVDQELWNQTIFGPKMAQLPKMISFSEKTIKLIFMYLMAPFICKISKKFLEWIQSYDEVPFQAMTNDPFAPNKIFFKKTINISFLCLLAPFIVQNLKKTRQSQSRVTRMSHFQAQNGLIVPNDNFLQKNRCKISIYLLAPFIVQNFKKILRADPKLWGHAIF